MTYKSFIFEGHSFDRATMTATFRYSFDGEREFSEKVQFEKTSHKVNEAVLERCLELALFVVGTSYYKCFAAGSIEYRDKQFSPAQAEFINKVYREGMSQYIFENKLNPAECARATMHGKDLEPLAYSDKAVLVLQSGGKDSLLLGQLLNEKQLDYSTWYMSTSTTYPKVIERLNSKRTRLAQRFLDKVALEKARQDGAMNGHVPVTYIAMAYALIDAVLHGENVVLTAIGQEGNEAHETIGDLAVNHQWSKTWEAEQLFANYVHSHISPNILVGSPLRPFTELRIAELFEQKCWAPYANGFSSCNLANYTQGHNNTDLVWCGRCAKCANTFLLFSPFVLPYELRRLFNGVDLFTSGDFGLEKDFKGLLGVEGVMKPFECVGEVEELRTAYAMTQARFGDTACKLPFAVPEGHFDYKAEGPSQAVLRSYLPEGL